MNNIIEKELNIEDMIYEIREKQVILDSDLAKLYHVETKRINEAAKNNPRKFPERFSWIVTEKEFNIISSRSKISTLNKSGNKRGSNIKYYPRVFTEQGVAMLATILKSQKAIETSINIMDAFVKMRHYIKDNLLNQNNINNIVLEDHSHILRLDGDLKLLQETFDKLEEKRKINEIYFNGQIYDAYSKIKDIFAESKEELILIDNYVDKTILDMIKNLKIKVIIITKENNKLTTLDIEKYNKQYHNLKVIYNETFHDRYFIIDRNKIYHCGTSINYIGSKTFSINILEDEIVKESLLNKIKKDLNDLLYD